MRLFWELSGGQGLGPDVAPRFAWKRVGISASVVTLSWTVPPEAPPGRLVAQWYPLLLFIALGSLLKQPTRKRVPILQYGFLATKDGTSFTTAGKPSEGGSRCILGTLTRKPSYPQSKPEEPRLRQTGRRGLGRQSSSRLSALGFQGV